MDPRNPSGSTSYGSTPISKGSSPDPKAKGDAFNSVFPRIETRGPSPREQKKKKSSKGSHQSVATKSDKENTNEGALADSVAGEEVAAPQNSPPREEGFPHGVGDPQAGEEIPAAEENETPGTGSELLGGQQPRGGTAGPSTDS